MACSEFEDVLVEYAELTGDERRRADAHLATCPGCREFLQALNSVDVRLTEQFARREVSGGFTEAVRSRVRREAAMRRPSFVPEILDFVGWGAIVALIALALYWVSALVPVSSESIQAAFSSNVARIACSVFLLISFLIGLRSFVDLKY